MKKPKLPESFTDNLEAIATGIDGWPITTDFADEWKVTEKNARDLIEYMYAINLITVKWLPEKQTLCVVRKDIIKLKVHAS
ncbi:hypothetical protein D3C87_1850730 [compost metagenome]